MNKKDLENSHIEDINNLEIATSELPLNYTSTTSMKNFSKLIPEQFNTQLINDISIGSSNKISERKEEDLLDKDISSNSNTLAMDIDDNNIVSTKLEKSKLFSNKGQKQLSNNIGMEDDSKNIKTNYENNISPPTTIVDLNINCLNKPDLDFSNLFNFSETKIKVLKENEKNNNTRIELLSSNTSSSSPKIINNNNNELLIT